MAADPKFASTPRLAVGRVAAANTGHDGSGTIVSLLSGVTAGTRVFSINAAAEVTTTAGMLRVWLALDATPNWRLYDEIPVPANTVSATVPGVRIYRTYADLVLVGTAHQIGVTMEKAEAIVCHVVAADLT